MEDAISRDSVTSSTSEDFVLVNGEPKLKVPEHIADLSEEIACAAAPATMADKLPDSTQPAGAHDQNNAADSQEDVAVDESDQKSSDPLCDQVIPSSQSVNALGSNSILENYPETTDDEDKSGDYFIS